MSVKPVVFIVAVAGALLAGCATQPAADKQLKPATPTTGEESAARNRARIHTELAASYYQLGNMGVALEEVRAATGIDPTFGPAYNVGGLVYAALKQDAQAEASFQRALSINPNDSLANNNYGRFLCDRKRESEGIRYFLAAVQNPLYRTPDRAYVNAGICARRMGNAAAAEGYFQDALRLRPGQPQALYNLSEMAYDRGDFEAARNDMNRLMRAVEPNAAALWLAIRIERKLGDAASAASYAQRLRKSFPDSQEARALSAGRFE